VRFGPCQSGLRVQTFVVRSHWWRLLRRCISPKVLLKMYEEKDKVAIYISNALFLIGAALILSGGIWLASLPDDMCYSDAQFQCNINQRCPFEAPCYCTSTEEEQLDKPCFPYNAGFDSEVSDEVSRYTYEHTRRRTTSTRMRRVMEGPVAMIYVGILFCILRVFFFVIDAASFTSRGFASMYKDLKDVIESARRRRHLQRLDGDEPDYRDTELMRVQSNA